ncbi:MAG: iron ABC transporter permease [Actinomycetota bacterium]
MVAATRVPAGVAIDAAPAVAAPSRRRAILGMSGFAVIATSAFVLAIAIGSVWIPPADVIAILAGASSDTPGWEAIVRDIRLPRTLTATLCGAGLAVAGVQMQTLFRNPLAGPYVLGISSGASLGVALVVLTAGAGGTVGFLSGIGPFGDLGVAAAAAAGSVVVLTMVLAVSRRVESVATILIVGLMFGQVVLAITTVLIAGAEPERIQAYLQWSFGSFRGVSWQELQILAPVIIVAGTAVWFTSKQLNAMLLGERYAASLGVDVRRTRRATVVLSSLLAGVVTAFAGPIAFLGVAVPHLARAVLGTVDHRFILPASAIGGAALALTAEIAAQLPGRAGVLPLNAVTALIGAPVVIWVIVRNRRATAGF